MAETKRLTFTEEELAVLQSALSPITSDLSLRMAPAGSEASKRWATATQMLQRIAHARYEIQRRRERGY